LRTMAKKPKEAATRGETAPVAGKPSALLDTRVIYCGDCLEQLRNLPDQCVDLIYIDPPFNSNRCGKMGQRKKESEEKRGHSYFLDGGRGITIIGAHAARRTPRPRGGCLSCS